MEDFTLGMDIGGTFTDLVLRSESGEIVLAKVPSQPDDPGAVIHEGIRLLAERTELSAGELMQRTRLLVHGTTVATNALLQHKLARTALITTKGFRDVLEIGRQRRPQQYSFFAEKARVLIPREFRFVVKERVNFKGYGESKLINQCKNGVRCSDEDHQANRRTEFKVTAF